MLISCRNLVLDFPFIAIDPRTYHIRKDSVFLWLSGSGYWIEGRGDLKMANQRESTSIVGKYLYNFIWMQQDPMSKIKSILTG